MGRCARITNQRGAIFGNVGGGGESHKYYENDEAQYIINSRILPENFVEFFFFDGEEIESISDNLRTKLREKIVEILQIQPLEIIIKQIGRLRDELIASEAQNQAQKDTLETRIKQLEAKESEIVAKSNAINAQNSQLQENAQKIKDLERKREKIIADSTAELQELTREKNEGEEKLHSFKQSLIESIKSVVFVSNENLIEKLKNEIQNIQSSAQKGDIEALKRLIPSIQAITNDRIDATKYEPRTIVALKDLFSDIIGALPSNLESKIAKDCSKIPLNYVNVIKETMTRAESSSLKGDIKSIKRLKTHLNDIKSQINELNTDDRAKMQQDEISEEIAKCEEKERDIKPRLEAFKGELEQLKLEKEMLAKEIDSLTQGIDTERVGHKLLLLDILRESMNRYKDRLISTLRDELHDKILEKYKQIITNDNVAELEIAEDFEICLKDKYGKSIIVESQSSGQKQILAISIFWALSELSNSKIPLIIDTPLSRIDEINRANIISKYYGNGGQVIILPHSGEMGQREYEFAKPNLAGLYKVCNSDDRSHATIRVASIEDIL